MCDKGEKNTLIKVSLPNVAQTMTGYEPRYNPLQTQHIDTMVGSAKATGRHQWLRPFWRLDHAGDSKEKRPAMVVMKVALVSVKVAAQLASFVARESTHPGRYIPVILG